MENPLDAILNLLADGKWHTLNEISTLEPCRRIPITTLMEVLNFFEEVDFAEENCNAETFVSEEKMTQKLQSFWKKIKWVERSEKQ